MPTHVITAEVGQRIEALRRNRVSLNAIAGTIEKEFGITLDPSTIRRHGRRVAGQPAKAPTKKRPRTKRDLALKAGDPIDEVQRLDASVRRIEGLLAMDLPPRDTAALSAELRKTLQALNAAKRIVAEGTNEADKDAADLRAKLMSFLPPDAPKPDVGSAVPDEPGSAGSSRAAEG